jgi:hypothetical protein
VSGGRDEKISDKDTTDNKICEDSIHIGNLHGLNQISNFLYASGSSPKGSHEKFGNHSSRRRTRGPNLDSNRCRLNHRHIISRPSPGS